MKPLRYFALLFSLLVPQASASAATDTPLTVIQRGNQLSVEGWLETRATREIAWSVLTDYEYFPEFVPGIRANRVLETQGRVKIVAQSGEVVTGMLKLLYEGTIRIEEFPDEGLSILFLSGPFKEVRGEWRMERAEKKQPLRLVYRMNMDMMKTPFPPPLAPSIAEQQVRTWVDVFGREMDKRMDNQMERRKAK
ncbi:MAG: SRPBCC family protein [Pseudomonadota bacterium]|nr:SRPBCC family protein [Pseudomonadota bacterium]MDP1572963.1 SRPBCC family protein [Pseudomonadota bacterium]MDP1906199.1 SRPBCC family protein [Pseudomonadota bacterium]